MSQFFNECIEFFKEYDKPTEAEFLYTFLRLRWKDEAITIAEVQGLTNVLNELASPVEPLRQEANLDDLEYTIKEGYYLETILVSPAIDSAPWLASDAGAVLIAPDEENPITAADGYAWRVGLFAANQTKKVIVKDLPQDSMLYFITRKIK